MLALVFLGLLCGPARTQPPPAATGPQNPSLPARAAKPGELAVTVTDENGKPVSGAAILLRSTAANATLRSETDYAGQCRFTGLAAGQYQLRVQKEGFYAVTVPLLAVPQTDSVEALLPHEQEVKEVVDVVESPPAIDATQTADTHSITGLDVLNIPYPVTRDYRKVLPFIPGVVQDNSGQPHLAGSATNQTQYVLDGFNLSQPATGLLDIRVSPDAIRSIEVQASRYSAQYGKASGGILGLTTGIGDDHYRYSATNFIPTVQLKKGLNFNNWVPRATFSGPLRKGKMWFFDGADGEYDLNIIRELPSGADTNPVWRVGNLAKMQVNLTPRNILTTSFLLNRFFSEHSGLSQFTPQPATTNLGLSAYLVSIQDQHYFPNGVLLELGAAVDQFSSQETPLGAQPSLLRPEGPAGNFFRTSRSRARRAQAIGNLYLPARNWHGRHQLQFGFDADRISYHQFADRRMISIVGETGLPTRQILFSGPNFFRKNNLELSAYGQDRWSPRKNLLLEPGLRLDWDEIVRHALLSPRLAATYMVGSESPTKLSAGIGTFYDATNLELFSRPLTGQRTDLFFAADGHTLLFPPVLTSFTVDQHVLQAPRYLNWSLGLERKLPGAVYLDLEFLQKRGHHAPAYFNRGGPTLSGDFVLRNLRQDRIHSLQLTLRRSYKRRYSILASYTRSRARTNAGLDFSIDNPVFAQQAPGPLPWDTPNRFISWGSAPLVKNLDLYYSVEWRDGFPFSVVNQFQQLVGLLGARRFPTFFALNPHLEKRFRAFGYFWAIRAGFDNVTNRRNPSSVVNNINSLQFLTFGSFDRRTFTGRVRFLGRK